MLICENKTEKNLDSKILNLKLCLAVPLQEQILKATFPGVYLLISAEFKEKKCAGYTRIIDTLQKG